MMAKEAEEKSASHEQLNSHRLRLAFWEQALEAFSHSSCSLYNNISPNKDHWLSAGSGLSAMAFNLIFSKNEVRVEFYMSRSQAEANQFVFDRLESQKTQIETNFGAPLTWQPLPHRKACRVVFAEPVDGYDKANWPEMIQWLVEHMIRLEQALSAPLEKIKQELKTTDLNKEPVQDAE